eukprot:TRINITY_DN37463_c0_g1_i1.p2 TRINITY_DN37463_c0_g1~~TRINITY_DN37463_c0_g1_i1.p2  ORF type:complete len:473 (+),score=120.33 TRINITY_DN37463_c0_g1_i1:66-1421(+)
MAAAGTALLGSAGAAAAVLLALLGYQLALLRDEQGQAQLAAGYARVNDMLRERERLCEESTREAAKPQQGGLGRLREENGLLGRENEVLERTNSELASVTERCLSQLLADREAHTGTREADPRAVVRRLGYEVTQLEGVLSDATRDHQGGLAELRGRIRALRLENADLRAQLGLLEQRQAAANCTDHEPHCASWAEQGECAHNAAYMLRRCRRSCGACGGDATCRDSSDRCRAWAEHGECKANAAFMLRRCPQSCGECRARPPGGRALSGEGRRHLGTAGPRDIVIRRDTPQTRFGIRFDGVRVVAVASGSPASAAGVAPGLFVQQVDGVDVFTHAHLGEALRKAGATTVLRVTEHEGVKVLASVMCSATAELLVVRTGGAGCGGEMRLATVPEATACRTELCRGMEQWAVVRLEAPAPGAPHALAGAGHGCRLQKLAAGAEPGDALCTRV